MQNEEKNGEILMVSKPERRSIKDGLHEGALKRRDLIKLGLVGSNIMSMGNCWVPRFLKTPNFFSIPREQERGRIGFFDFTSICPRGKVLPYLIM
jgi:hypothetical protein